MPVKITSGLVWLCLSNQLPKECSLSLEALCTSFAWSLWVVEGVLGLPRVHLHLPCETTPATETGDPAWHQLFNIDTLGFVQTNLFLRLGPFNPVQSTLPHSRNVLSIISWVSWIKELLLLLLMGRGDGSWHGHLKLQPITLPGDK